MPSFNLFDIASQAMSAQTIRLNTIASNMANVDSISGDKETAFRSIHPIFTTKHLTNQDGDIIESSKGVLVDQISKSDRPNEMRYDPHHPKANKDGFVYLSNVNIVEEMADMIAASRTFQSNAQIIATTKDLMQQTVNLGR